MKELAIWHNSNTKPSMKTRKELKEIYDRKGDLDLLDILSNKSQYEATAIEVVQELIDERGGEGAIRQNMAVAQKITQEESPIRAQIRQLLKKGSYENEIREELSGQYTDEQAFDTWLNEELDNWEKEEEEKSTDGGTIGRAAIGAGVGALVGGGIFGVIAANVDGVAGPGAGVIIICFFCVKLISGKGSFHWSTLVFSFISVIGAIVFGLLLASAI